MKVPLSLIISVIGENMGRYSYSGRLVAENQHDISIYWLRKKGLLTDYCYQTLTWSCRGEKTGSISIQIKINEEEKFARLEYIITRRSSGKKDEFDYRIPIVTTKCNFGGIRYWFQCPAMGCGRRVAKLYQGQDIFACRHCYNLTYASRNENPTYRGFPYKQMTIDSKIDKLYERLKKRTYKGKPTRVMKRIMKLENLVNWNPYELEKYLYNK